MLIFINFVWAATYTAMKVAVSHAGPITVTFWVFLVACVALYPFYSYEKRKLIPASVGAGTGKGKAGDWLRFSMLSILGIIPPSILLAWGLDRSLAINGAVLSLLIPVQMALLAGILLQEKMTWVRWISFVLAIGGILIISDFDWKTLGIFQGKYLLGNFLIFIGGCGSSFYNTYAKKLLANYTPVQVVLYGYVMTLLFTAALLVWLEPAGLSSFLGFGWATWVSIGVLAVFSWGLGVTLFFWLLVRFEVTQLSVSIYLLPVFGVLISTVTLRERFTLSMMTGSFMVLVAAYLVTSYESRRNRKLPPAKAITEGDDT
jgi:drug/metabolite transporter (DMT)-like permease